LGGLDFFADFFLGCRFDSVDSADMCIEALRKYRNLHPSFSKVRFPPSPASSFAFTDDLLLFIIIYK
jgi:hypothetical protein